jgi:hypothetical protein
MRISEEMDDKKCRSILKCKVGGQVNMTLDLLECQEMDAINRPQTPSPGNYMQYPTSEKLYRSPKRREGLLKKEFVSS